MWNQFRSKLRLQNKSKWLMLLLVGLLLIVIAIPTTEKSEKYHMEKQNDSEVSVSYENRLEERLKHILEQVDGVGAVEVMITLKSTGQKVVEKDLQLDQQILDEEDSTGGSRSTKEESSTNTSVFEETSDGSLNPYVSKEYMPEVEGVLIIAQGGDDPVVIRDITEAVQALFHLDAHKIKIMKRNA